MGIFPTPFRYTEPFVVDATKLGEANAALRKINEVRPALAQALNSAANAVGDGDSGRPAGHEAQFFTQRSRDEYKLRSDYIDEVMLLVTEVAQSWFTMDDEVAYALGAQQDQ